MAAPTPQWVTTARAQLGAAGGTMVFTLPVEAVALDRALIAVGTAPASPVDPGWQSLVDTSAAPTVSAGRMHVWWYQLTPADITAGQLQLTWTGAGRGIALIAAGWSSTVMVHDVAVDTLGTRTTAVATPAALAVADSAVVHLHGVVADEAALEITWIADAATTEVAQETGESLNFRNSTLLMAREDQLVPAATTPRTATSSSNVQAHAAAIILSDTEPTPPPVLAAGAGWGVHL